MPLPERVRVKSKKTGHEFTRSAAWYEANKDAVKLLEDKPATQLDGTDIPMKPSESIAEAGARRTGGTSASKRTSKRTTKKTAAPTSSGPTSEAGSSATTPKENS